MNKYIDFKLIKAVPNKYNIKPADIGKFKVLDWDNLKKYTCYNEAMKKTGEWYCHSEGSNGGGFYGDNEDEFWIGFNKKNGKVDYHFTSGEGMCHYRFDKFYDAKSIENKWDMNVQVNAMWYLNMLLDEGVVELSNSLNSIISSLNQSKLLLDTSDVTTSEKIFTLEDDYTNYKELYFEIEMNYTSSSNISLFTNIIRVDTIRRDIKYTVYITTAGSAEAALSTKFISDNNTDIKIYKSSSTFNGCRRLRIFGVK